MKKGGPFPDRLFCEYADLKDQNFTPMPATAAFRSVPLKK